MKKLIVELELGKNYVEVFENLHKDILNYSLIKELANKYLNEASYVLFDNEEDVMHKYYRESRKESFPKVILLLEIVVFQDDYKYYHNNSYKISSDKLKQIILDGNYKMLKIIIGKDTKYGVEEIKAGDNFDLKNDNLRRTLAIRLNNYTDNMVESVVNEWYIIKKIYNELTMSF